MKKYATKPLVFVVYFGLFSVFRFEWTLTILWWFLGGLMGLGLEYVDRLFYVYVIKPYEQLSQYVRGLVAVGRYRDGLRLLKARKDEQRQLTVKSVLFAVIWVPLAFFVASSTASELGKGFVMGIGLNLLYDIGRDWSNLGKLKYWFFWPIRREVSDTETKLVVGVYTGVFLLMSLMLMI